MYSPPLPTTPDFKLTPEQSSLEQAYKAHLQENFGIQFNHLFTITNLPIGRTKFQLVHRQLIELYVKFLADHFNPSTVENLMCRTELSVDYRGYLYDMTATLIKWKISLPEHQREKS